MQLRDSVYWPPSQLVQWRVSQRLFVLQLQHDCIDQPPQLGSVQQLWVLQLRDEEGRVSELQ